jgi:hypothetical protein
MLTILPYDTPLIVTTSQPTFELNEAREEIARIFEPETKTAAENRGNQLYCQTPNHRILSVEGELHFEKTEWTVPIDRDGGEVPICIFPILAAQQTGEPVYVPGNETKRWLLDLTRDIFKKHKTPFSAHFIPETPAYSRLLRERYPKSPEGGLEQNVNNAMRQIRDDLGTVRMVLQLSSDMAMLKGEHMNAALSLLMSDWHERMVVTFLCNTLANGTALGFPRNYSPFRLRISDTDEKSPAKEPQIYVFGPRYFKEYAGCIGRFHDFRKLADTRSYGPLLKAIFHDGPSFVYEYFRHNLKIKGHAIHELIWDVDSVQDYLLTWERRLQLPSQPFAQPLRELSDALRDPATTRGIYKNKREKMQAYFDTMRIPEKVMIENREHDRNIVLRAA